MCGAMIAPDNSVPYSLPRTTHSHSQTQQTKDSHTIWISGQECLVNSDAGEVIDISRLSQTDYGMNQDVCLPRPSSPYSKFSVGTMHRIPA